MLSSPPRLLLAAFPALLAGAPRRTTAQTSTAAPAARARADAGRADSTPRPLTAGAPEVVRRIAPGEAHAYTVQLRAGEFAHAVVDQRGVDVAVRVLAPDGAQVVEVDSPNGDAGPEPVDFGAATAGTYRLIVRVLPGAPSPPGATYAVRLTAVLSPAARAAEVAAARARTDSVLAWLAAAAAPIQSVTAGSGSADLAPFGAAVGAARVVGLGEATHGSREFFQFKHRALEYLVRERGFRVFAVEASLSAAEDVIDPWVQGGPGAVGPVLDSQGFWTWNTEEVRDLLVWLRAYNASVPAAARVHVVGIDVQENAAARRMLLAFLRRVAPERAAAAESLMAVPVDSLAGQTAQVLFRRGDTTVARAGRAARATLMDAGRGYAALAGFLGANERAFAARTSAAEAARAVRQARVLRQHTVAYGDSLETGPAVRDRFMAENLRGYLDAAPVGTRAVLWAHNGHVAHYAAAGDSARRLGDWLRTAYGAAYYAVGFSFGGGAFQARDLDPRAAQPNALTEFRIGAPDPESVDGMLGRAVAPTGVGAGVPAAFVDLRRPAPAGAVRDWLAAPHVMTGIGSGFQRAWGPEMYTGPVALAAAYDGVVYFRTTTRARPNPSVPNVAGASR